MAKNAQWRIVIDRCLEIGWQLSVSPFVRFFAGRAESSEKERGVGVGNQSAVLLSAEIATL